ncbi:MAG: MBL fold metallo-hydrolase [candidate division Zixibacteria bacterium]
MNDEMILEILELGPYFVNCYIVGDPETKEGMIIDPGYDPERIIAHAEKFGLEIKKIVITHGHADHIGALEQIRKHYDVPVLIGEGDANMLTDSEANLSGFSGQNVSTSPPNETIKEGDTVEIGRYSFKIFETPGHSPGSVSIFGHGVVFTGDALFLGSIGRTDFPGCSYETLIDSIKTKLLTLPVDTNVYSGHGPDTTIGQERDYNPFI